MKLTLGDLFVYLSDEGADRVRQIGYIPGGNNGPYGDPETPVRNTAHWVQIFKEAYKLTTEERYRNSLNDCLTYLMSEEARPHGYSFHCRKSPRKNKCNGLIGQAWVIEALSEAYKVVENEALLELAEEVFLLHPQRNATSCWNRVEIDGSLLTLDRTFNHQLWFAAAGGLLSEHEGVGPAVENRVNAFLDTLPDLLTVYDTGLIYHPLRPKLDGPTVIELYRDTPKTLASIFYRGFKDRTSNSLWHKAIGYHSFNMYALSLLYQTFPNHAAWESGTVQQAIEFCNSEAFRREIENNEYGYPYNVSGIEMAYATETFERIQQQSAKWWLDTQFSYYYFRDGRLSNDTDDPQTLEARIYEATRLPGDIEITIPSENH